MASVSGKLAGGAPGSPRPARRVPVLMIRCVECDRPLGLTGSGALGDGVLCQWCAAGHAERTRRQEVTREALAWAFVTLVFLALVGWGVAHLVATGALTLR